MDTYKADRRISTSIVAFFVLQSLNAALKTIGAFPSSFVGYVSSITGGFILLYIIRSLPITYKRSNKLFVRTYLIFIIAYAYSIFSSLYIRHEPIALLLHDSALWTFAFWIPIGVFTYSVENLDVLYQRFYKGSFIIGGLMMLTFFWFLAVGTKTDAKDYNMFFSYTLILPLLIHINEYFNKRKPIVGIIMLIELFAIIMYGSRGALLCLASFFILKALTGNISRRNKRTILFSIIVVSCLGFILYNNQDLLSAFGLKSRFFSKMDSGEVMSGRDYVWQAGMMMVSERPLLGYGIGGEYVQMTRLCEFLTGVYVDELASTTPHNGVIQLMLNFGAPIGIIVALWIITAIRKVRLFTSPFSKDLFIIFFSGYIIPSMTVGDGIFVKPGIAIFIFLALSSNNRFKYEYR